MTDPSGTAARVPRAMHPATPILQTEDEKTIYGYLIADAIARFGADSPLLSGDRCGYKQRAKALAAGSCPSCRALLVEAAHPLKDCCTKAIGQRRLAL